MKSLYWIVLFASLVASCSSAPSGNAVRTAIVQTEIALPTKTIVFDLTAIPTPLPPTPIPLADLDLEPILVLPGDLPDGYIYGQVSNILPRYIDHGNQPLTEYQIYQEFEQNNESAGGVTVMGFDSEDSASQSMCSVSYDMAGWGEIQDLDSMPLSTLNEKRAGDTGMDILFRGCTTVVHVRMTGTVDKDSITS